MTADPAPQPLRHRLLFAGLLVLGGAATGWLAFAYGAAALVLHAGDCAGRTPLDALLAVWLGVVIVAFLAPPALMLRRGRWRPVLRALGLGLLQLVVIYLAVWAVVGFACR